MAGPGRVLAEGTWQNSAQPREVKLPRPVTARVFQTRIPPGGPEPSLDFSGGV